MVTHLLTPVLPKLDPSYHLLIDEVGGHVVLGGVVPRREDLFAEEEPPGRIAFLGTLLLGILLTLGDGIHDMVTATAQGGHLRAQGWGSPSEKLSRQGRTYKEPSAVPSVLVQMENWGSEKSTNVSRSPKKRIRPLDPSHGLRASTALWAFPFPNVRLMGNLDGQMATENMGAMCR